MRRLRHGYLVKTTDGYYGVVVSINGSMATVFTGNGLLQDFRVDGLELIMLPRGSGAPQSFHEIIRTPKVKVDYGSLFGRESK